MQENARIRETHPLAERDDEKQKLEQLLQEINILKLEGSVFCFDPKQAKKREEKFTVDELAERPVTLQPHPSYGQPSTLAYKVLQAIFTKIAATTYPYSSTVAFSRRELARIVGRKWSGVTSRQMHDAIMQLQTLLIHCALYDRKTKQWERTSFSIVTKSWHAGRGNVISQCVVEVDNAIVDSLNQGHVAYINLDKLKTLDVIGMVVYKRLYFHLCNTWKPHRGMKERELYFHKHYDDICREWLGGVKAEQYIADIMRRHFGARLEALKETGLISRYRFTKKDGRFVFDCKPGKGFFADYEQFYVRRNRPERTAADDMIDEVREPLQIVGYFHELLGRDSNIFDPKEVEYASALLRDHGLQEVRDLTAYAVEQARATRFNPRWFNAVSKYRPAWEQDLARRRAYEERLAEIAACPICSDKGMVTMKTATGAITTVRCPHDAQLLTVYEGREGLRRLPS